MTRGEWRLTFVLRLVALLMGLALVAVFMPRSWIATCHEWVGLKALPEGPLVEYLARSVSAFYAILGGLLWIIAGKQRRYAAVITYLALMCILFGLAILVIDFQLGMPLWWKLAEGPFVMGFGVLVLFLQARA